MVGGQSAGDAGGVDLGWSFFVQGTLAFVILVEGQAKGKQMGLCLFVDALFEEGVLRRACVFGVPLLRVGHQGNQKTAVAI